MATATFTLKHAPANYRSLFETEKASPEKVVSLINFFVDAINSGGSDEDKGTWAVAEEKFGIGYSRGWLIVRRYVLEQTSKGVLVNMDDVAAKARKAAPAGTMSENHVKDVQARLVLQHRDGFHLSWGEISVRLGIPESRVRSLYKHNAGKKDLGLRIGKGGRYAYNDPTLYQENRKQEGAWIASDRRGRPKPEDLLNFKPKAGGQQQRQRKQAPPKTDQQKANTGPTEPTTPERERMRRKVVLLQKKANDKAVTPEERESLLAKITELKEKYSL